MGFYAYGLGTKSKYWGNGRLRQHPVSTVLSALRMMSSYGGNAPAFRRVAKELGVPYKTLASWWERRFLPKRGNYTFEKMLALVTLARRLYMVSKRQPITCLYHAVNRTPSMTWGQVKLYLYFQAMPTLPGFPLYADRIANEKAERYGLGLRNYSGALGVDHPRIPAEVPRPENDRSQTAPRVAPRQIGRRFVREVQVTSPIPSRKYNLL